MDTDARGLARQKFEHAQQELEKGHLDRAEDFAKEALEFDSTYDEVRLWLADLYLVQDETYLASRQLQDVLYHDRENAEAWEKLGKVDPASALRLKTLQEIAPDPFVATHRAEFEDEFEELGSESDIEVDVEEGSWRGHADAGDFLEDSEEAEEAYEEGEDVGEAEEDEDDAEAEEATAAGADSAGAGGIPERGPAPWEYEQDRVFLERWLSDQRIAAMATELRAMWEEAVKLVPAYQHAAHMDRARHPEIAAETDKCLHKLGMHDCELLMVAERSLYPLAMQDAPPV